MINETLKTILLYYAMAWAVITPLLIVAAIIMNKRSGGEYVKRYDAFLDRLLGLKPEIPVGNDKKEKTEDGEERSINETENDGEEANRKAEIARFVLLTGDVYRCNLTTWQMDSMSGQILWSVKNKFTGTIDENTGEFHALREGIAEIFCNRIPAYIITVLPSDGEWEPGNSITTISKKGTIDDEFASYTSKRKPQKIDFKRSVIHCGQQQPGNIRNLYGYGPDRKLERVLSEWKWSQETEENFVKRISTRAREVGEDKKDEIPGTRIWIHIGSELNVDACIMLRRTTHNTMLFGVCRNWREGGTVAEVQGNPGMVIQMFADLMPEEFNGREDMNDGNVEQDGGSGYPMDPVKDKAKQTRKEKKTKATEKKQKPEPEKPATEKKTIVDNETESGYEPEGNTVEDQEFLDGSYAGEGIEDTEYPDPNEGFGDEMSGD